MNRAGSLDRTTGRTARKRTARYGKLSPRMSLNRISRRGWPTSTNCSSRTTPEAEVARPPAIAHRPGGQSRRRSALHVRHLQFPDAREGLFSGAAEHPGHVARAVADAGDAPALGVAIGFPGG